MSQMVHTGVDEGAETSSDPFIDTIPTGYREGYLEAAKVDPVLAKGYAKHTMTGDPLLKEALESMAGLEPELRQEYIRRGMDQEADFTEAPEALQNFFQYLDRPDGFKFDPERAAPGIRAFHRSSDLFFASMALYALLTGFTELLSRSFAITGRTAGNLRRLQQNSRHVTEVMLPGGLARYGDGWKLTIRIRMIHGQIQKLLLNSGEWDVDYEGLPLHMSHMGLGATGFSAVAFSGVEKLGVRLTEEERDGYMHTWCYVAHLMGVPDDILYHNEQEALHFRKIAKMVEGDELGESAAAVAHGYLSAVPRSFGIEDPKERDKLLKGLYRASRALIGNETADKFGYPKQSSLGVITAARVKRRGDIILGKIIPGKKPQTFTRFAEQIDRSAYDDGFSYRMPDAVKDTDSSAW